MQVLVTLRFLASVSFLQVVGDTVGLDKSTFSRTVDRVCDALVRKWHQFIKWPSVQEKDKIKKGVFEIGGFPNVIGCIDGTHVRIQAPTQDEPAYVNRKGWHSINVQAVCDDKGNITYLCASWPGSTHDSHIFRTSNLRQHLEANHTRISDGFVLGDSGYACRPYLLTPYLHPQGNPQQRYNDRLCRTRVTIERTFGRLKRRFHFLYSEIRMNPGKVCKIILTCAILHNIAILRNEVLDVDDAHVRQDQPLIDHYRGRNDDKAIRDHIASTFFAN
ncbi:putative nuclease HARBI1 [Haliotis rubra]|uniref:putative nuclease HARBI1 n=1 Tax=Haliotis rubra TaxID=36100 RepID=UPI001EE52C24|nr:putative nuclease HARBI1 [Haliotis rubra]